jgi:hypothetical protein
MPFNGPWDHWPRKIFEVGKKMDGKIVEGKGKKVYFTNFSDNHTLLSLL